MIDIPLLIYFFFWYLGNYYYNIQNKLAANAAGGADFAMTISTAQLLVGVVSSNIVEYYRYAAFLWVAPD
jgi:solute carrier family 35 protein E1